MASSKSTFSSPWTFKARFRKGAFGWKSAPAVTRVKEAVAELKAVARAQPPSPPRR
jgi:hypothetical protein